MQQVLCPKCKALVDAKLNFCPSCGSVMPLPNSQGLKPGENPTQVNQQHVAQAILNEGKKNQNPKTAFAVGLITTIVVIVLIVILLITGSSGSSDTTDSTTSVGDVSAVSSVLESSAPESSVGAVITEESSEVSVEESSTAEESSEASVEESSTEESSEASAVEAKVITAEKPDGWNNIYCYIYVEENMFNNGKFPGDEMTDNGDGTYSYQIPEKFDGKDVLAVFSTTERSQDANIAQQYPYSGDGGFNISDKASYTVNDFEAYAESKKS